MLETDPSTPAPSRGRRLLVLLLLGCAVALLYGAGIRQVHDEVDFATLELAAGPRGADFVEVQATVMTVDPLLGTMTARLAFCPQGDYEEEDLLLARDLDLRVNSSRGRNEIPFKAGHRMDPVEVDLDLVGSTADYPFDRHESILQFQFTRRGDREPVPLALHLDAVVTGYELAGSVLDPGDPTGMEIGLQVRRTPSVRIYSVILMLIMLSLSGAAVLVNLVFYLQRRKVEVTLFGFMTAMLFAFPAMRNTMPGVPPVGGLCDYVAFFWAEGLVALCILSGVFCWAFLPPNRPR